MSTGTVISDSARDDVRDIVVRTKVHDRPAVVAYRCRGDVVVLHAIDFKLENDRDAQDAFEMERRSLTDEIGRPCVDTTRPSWRLKRAANEFGLDPGINVLWQAGDHALHLRLNPVGPDHDYWSVTLVTSTGKVRVACDPPE
jgi:hypothetical protein